MKKVKEVMLFSNGNVAAFDESGDQIGELQINVLVEWAERAHRLGYDPDGVSITTPAGRKWKVIPLGDGRFNIKSE